MRRREAAARCPQLHVAAADADRDARFFEGVIAAVDDLVPRAEVLRPGLLVLPVRGAARYFGSEQQAAERLIDAVAAAGAECQVGIADQLSTAVFAARAGRIVQAGGDAKFLSVLSIRQLATEPSLSGPGREELTDLLWRMGIRTIGQFAALSRTDVASRFGADGVTAHLLAMTNAAARYQKLKIWKSSPVIEPAAISKFEDILINGHVLDANKRVKFEDLVRTDFASKAK